MSIWRFHFAYEAAGFKAERGIEFPRLNLGQAIGSHEYADADRQSFGSW